jgi:CTP:molybdopterin cytidylyltransferase MocA
VADNVAAIVLAAGFSSRMGEFKPLLDLAGMTALERTVTLFRTAGVRDVRVVTGHRAEELAPLLERLDVRIVPNPNYREGMFASVAAGAETIGEEIKAFFVLPVDLPLVRPATVRKLIEAYDLERSGIVYPAFMGERGHPPLITGWLAPEIVRWNGAGGLQGILLQWEGVAQEVEVADEQILRDMDTPGDYRRLRERAERLHIPTEAECRVLLEEVFRVEPHIIRHGQAVAEVAVLLGQELNRAGCSLDISLLGAAGLLHDLARKEPDHARTGARLLREGGYGAVADLVATHMDISVTGQEPVSAGEVVYLADKVVQGERRVPLAERFRTSMERHARDPAILGRIAGRLKTALTVQRRLEAVLGRSLTEVIGTI